MSRQGNLSREQIRFCELYAGGYSSTQAYQEAYGQQSREAARSGAQRLLKKDYIHNLIVDMQKEVYKSMCLNAEKIAIKLAEMGFAEKNDEYYTPQIQVKALDMLQKQMGLQKAVMENTNNIIVTIDEVPSDEGTVEKDT